MAAATLGTLLATGVINHIVRRANHNSSSKDPAGIDWEDFLQRLRRSVESVEAPNAQVRNITETCTSTNWASNRLRERMGASELPRLGPYPTMTDVHKEQAFQISLLHFAPHQEIPAHDHPEISAVMLCTQGAVVVENYELWRRRGEEVLLRRVQAATMLPGSTSALTTTAGNIHRLRALKDSEVIDIFAPAYSPQAKQQTSFFEISRHPYGDTSDIFPASYRAM